MIDFSHIHAFNQGQRESFEELICQLGRLEDVPTDSIYKRVEGAGGDGGVEAYWTKVDGKKIGYQAKYFTRSGDIDWSQIDKSVEQALKTHPELDNYVIAIACDLTEKSGVKRKGMSGWGHWDNNVKKWSKWALDQGISDIKFTPWTKSEITALLAKKKSQGLLEYFFGNIQLSMGWYHVKLNESIYGLGDRFHPEDHVDVEIQKLFSVISRSPEYIAELSNHLSHVERYKFPYHLSSKLQTSPDSESIKALVDAIAEISIIHDSLELDPQHSWEIDKWKNLLNILFNTKNDIEQWLWDYKQGLERNSSERYYLDRLLKEIRDFSDHIRKVKELLNSRYMVAESQKSAFIQGHAGSGKSHLLAKCAETAINDKHPAILLLGQRITNTEIWTQISQMLGLTEYSTEELLGAIDASGKASGTRVLLLIDAINEGVGSKYWDSNIASILNKLRDYSHICCIISCRSEYFELAIPTEVSTQIPCFSIRGFETIEEQANAARIYLDRKGIVRPSTPWLSPEFINPLFLRSICISLERDNKSELPPGLNGSRKILRFYLDSLERNIKHQEGGLASSSKLARACQDIAGSMLEQQADHLGLDACLEIINRHFKNVNPKTESDWLTVFINHGILRRDPNPSDDIFDDDDIIRFSFQRFQDFLMAEKSLSETNNPLDLFGNNGVLDFCISEDRLAWKWRGLLDALSVALPERLQTELVDALPGGFDVWWAKWELHEIFAESIKWRDHEAFTKRTLQLLNNYSSHRSDSLDLLLQVATSATHPWNAGFMHNHLIKYNTPDRDAYWTLWVNSQDDDSISHLGALIDWCHAGQTDTTKPENQYLAALMLCWFLTSSNRTIRDKSTKAVANLFLFNESLFPKIVEQFRTVDDLYLHERIYAAAFSSCCINSDRNRLISYATIVYESVFKQGQPPLSLLLRDFSLGIIELAEQNDALPDFVERDKCYPPYKSPKLRLHVSEELIRKVSDKAGDDQILLSATSFGDFSRYEIEPRVRGFLRTTLDKKVSLSSRQKAQAFEMEVIGDNKKKREAYDELKKVCNPYSYGIYKLSIEADSKKPTKEQLEQWMNDITVAKATLLELLSDSEAKRFCLDINPYLLKDNTEKRKTFDLNSLKRWVAKKAYDYGWNSKRFTYDRSTDLSYSRDRPSVERIGKKYQWMALNELLCRLADNYWMSEEYDSELPQPYCSPLDIGFVRDIDPTILQERANHSNIQPHSNSWAFNPVISIDQVEEMDLPSWPFKSDPADQIKALPVRRDPDGTEWLVIYEHQSITHKYEDEFKGEHSLKLQEFRFVSTLMVSSKDIVKIVKSFKEKESIHFSDWSPQDITDAAFLNEAPWRHTWPKEKWLKDLHYAPEGCRLAHLATNYVWESHLDAALPEGYSSHLPTAWLANELGLTSNKNQSGVWINESNEIVFKEFKGEDGGSICLLRIDDAELLSKDEYTFISIMIAERNAWPGGSNSNASWRRSEGICWKSGRGVESSTWFSDRTNKP
ncbi:NACHT domain-containing NTPase [Neptuniibacter sp. 2_MG-2023]|uniref:NACHT domain-containing protein n=1 Tax=Neptuniibacter sp. 2_MG-2023 TaxID=3062671 RepID=UPI0026E11B27|nr:hypothetical protein [Neptuniibacter sp. 2_MG-2023]MDO6514039.1 hypothetical protein [Neptuniibacter sp. 2_MG-2023]